MLSDIVTASDTRLTSDSYNGIKTHEHTQVHQNNPSPSTWQLWRRGLHLLAYRDTRKLLKPLGAWLVHHSALRQNFSLFSPSSNQVYQQDNNKWYSYNRDPFLPCRYERIGIEVPANPPDDSFPIDASNDSNLHFRADPSSSLQIQQPLPTLIDQLQTFFHSHVEILAPLPLSRITRNWTTSSLRHVAASDGSVVNQDGTYGWIISSKDETRLIQCKGRCFGYPMNSYRAEAFGLCSLLFFLDLHFGFNEDNELNPGLDLFCDNKALVDNIQEMRHPKRPVFPNDTLSADYDVL